MKTMVFFAANGVLTAFFTVIGLVLYLYGPCIEPYVAGYVIQIKPPTNIFRGYVVKRESNREVEVGCFRLPLHKLATAVPVKYEFRVEARLSERIPVSAYLSDDHHFQSESDFQTHPVNQTWTRDYCFEMPGTIADNQRIRVSGHAEHRRLIMGYPWPFWLSETPVPEFTILPTYCYRDDGSVDRTRRDCRQDGLDDLAAFDH